MKDFVKELADKIGETLTSDPMAEVKTSLILYSTVDLLVRNQAIQIDEWLAMRKEIQTLYSNENEHHTK